MDFVTDSLFTGSRFRALTLVDNFGRATPTGWGCVIDAEAYLIIML